MPSLSRASYKEKEAASPIPEPEDEVLDLTLRPTNWEDFIGQEKIKKNLQIIIQAARKRKEPSIEHLLFYGNAGLGKTSLSRLVAKEMNTDIRVISAPTLERIGDLAAILTSLSAGDVLFLDECHRLRSNVEELLYPAMEDFKLHLILGKGAMAKTMEITLPSFTLIGASTRIAMLSAPLRNRFGATFQLRFYDEQEIAQIIQRSAKILEIEIEPQATQIIAQRARFTPRVANRLLKRTRDFAQIEGKGIITAEIARHSLDSLEIDQLGLEPGDRKVLQTIIEKFAGGPAGLQAVAAASSEEEETILDIYEPYLMQLGFIKRTPRGRVATKLAYQHLGISPRGQKELI